MTYYEFKILEYLMEHKNSITNRQISDDLLLSNAIVMNEINKLKASGFVSKDGSITKIGENALAPYKVHHAVILAAGFGSRMMPATADRPKPLVRVNGQCIIGTLLDALIAAGIDDITIVRGYKKEAFDSLLTKYPNLHFIDNDDYDKFNNISSAVLISDAFQGGSYLCEADLYVTNPNIIRPYQFKTNILGSWSIETDDWSYKMDENGQVSHYQKGNTYCWNYYGISYWTPEDCKSLNDDWKEIFSTEAGKDVFWEQVPFQLRGDKYKVTITPCNKQDIMEIDNYYELQQLDSSYK